MVTLAVYYMGILHKQAKGFPFFAVGWASGVKIEKKLPVPTENTIFHHSRG